MVGEAVGVAVGEAVGFGSMGARVGGGGGITGMNGGGAVVAGGGAEGRGAVTDTLWDIVFDAPSLSVTVKLTM